MQNKTTNILALDVGARRIGVASGNSVARLPRPITTLLRDASLWSHLEKLIQDESISILIVGLPRNLKGQDTPQTTETRSFVEELKQRTGLPVVLQDEALTSRQAEAELAARGKRFAKGDIDALAAVYILEDYLNSREHIHA